MGDLILHMQMSVDGYVEAADPFRNWQVWGWGMDWPWDSQLRERFNQSFERAGAILLSRKMAEEGYLEHWAEIGEATKDDPDFRFARRIGELDKVVISSMLTTSRWPRTRVISGDFSGALESLKSDPTTYLTFGGTGFASALVAEDAIDEFELFVNPAALGAGKSIFLSRGMELHLLDSTGYSSGIVVNRYRPLHRG